MSRDRDLRRRLRRPCHRGVLRRARPRGRPARRRCPSGSTRCAAARCRSTSRASRSCSRATATGSSFTLDVAEAVDGADFLYVAVGTPPTYSGDADLSRRLDGRRRAAAPSTAARSLVMKSTVPVGTGDKVRAALDARGLDARRLRLEPGVPRRGHRAARLHAPRPDRRRLRSTTPTATRVAELHYAASTRPIVRTDVASAEMIKLAVERVPLDADQLHQRDRERLRARRRRRRGGRARAWASTTASARTSCAPASATAARASRRTSPRSSSSRATPATTSSCSPR